jgi:hypothetical protein
MGFFTRDKDPRPFVDEQDVAMSVLYFLWRDDILVESDEHPGVAKLLVLDHFPNHRESICAELFCLRFIAGKMGVTMGMSDVVKRKTICSFMEALQLSMTGQLVNPNSTNDAALVKLRRAFVEHIAEVRSEDAKWAEGVERTQSYVPAFSLLKERIEHTSTILTRHAPNLQMAFQEIAIDFCGRVGAPDREQVQAGAFAYLSMWMNMVKDFMPMYRMK